MSHKSQFEHHFTSQTWARRVGCNILSNCVVGKRCFPKLSNTFFRRRAATPTEKIRYEDEGWILYVALHSSALILWLSTPVYLMVPSAIAWASMPIPSVFRWACFCIGILVWIPMIWTLASLGKNLTDTVATRSNAFLVTTGPNRWVRHPYYSTTAIIMLSVTILTDNSNSQLDVRIWLLPGSHPSCTKNAEGRIEASR